MSRRIYILGAGPAGMALAYYAEKHKISYSLFESSPAIGGNCKTIDYKDFKYDTGAHRFHDKNQDVTNVVKQLLGDDLQKVSSPSKIFWNGKFVEFPINAIDILGKVGFYRNFRIFLDNLFNQFKSNNNIYSFKDLAYSNYGKTLANLFLINYTEKLWGCDAEQLAPDITGGRLKNLDVVSVIKGIFNRKNVKHLDGSFLYPKQGFGQIFTTILEQLDSKSVFLESPVVNLVTQGQNIKNIVFSNGRVVDVDKKDIVISTLPMPLLLKGFYPRLSNDILNCLSGLKYRSLRLFILFLNKDKFTNNASIYFPQDDIPFTRIYEPKNRSKQMAPDGKTCIVVELPYDSNKSSSEVNYNIDDITSILVDNNLVCKEDVFDSQILDVPYAYPVITKKIKNELEKVYDFLKNFNNLQIVGRSADFKYSHVHDLFHQAKSMICSIKPKV